MHADHRTSLRTIARAALSCVVAGCASASAHPQSGYAPSESFVLAPPRDHMRGRIELLEDSRIRPEMRKAITEAYGDDPCADHPARVLDALCGDPHHAPLRPAMLRLVDADGKVIATRTLERPLAQLAAARLYGNDRQSYMLTVDMSVGMGSYAGPYTRFAEPNGRDFGWLLADSAGVADTLTMVSTLKTAWQLVRYAPDRSVDFFMVRCRPDLSAPADSVAFTTTYERVTFDGTRWRLLARSEPGCYESDEPFPARSKFP
jgi:hypothetical protein